MGVQEGDFPQLDSLLDHHIRKRHIDERGVSVHRSASINEAQQRLHDIKTELFQSSILTTVLNDILIKQSSLDSGKIQFDPFFIK